MNVNILIYADLSRPNPTMRGYAMQGDSGSRTIGLVLRNNGAEWIPPENCRVEVRYTKSDGTGGVYDTLPDGSSAYLGNVLGVQGVGTVPQMFTVPGAVKVSVAFCQGDDVLCTFPVVIDVIKCPGVDVKSENYENLSPYVKKTGWTGGKLLGTDDTGTIVEVEAGADSGSEENSKPAVVDIAVTEGADRTVTMVNTLAGGGTETLVVTPDANGNPSKLTYNGIEIPITWTEAAGEETA